MQYIKNRDNVLQRKKNQRDAKKVFPDGRKEYKPRVPLVLYDSNLNIIPIN
jgi:hypothetical protein